MTDTLALHPTQIDAAGDPAALRTAAQARLERAAALRAEADDEERAAWRLQGEAAMLERAGRAPTRARWRPAVEGHAWLSRNRVITLMERLGIDLPIHPGEGLHQPLSAVETALGIRYSRVAPPLGTRLDAAERACA